jgi:transposase/transposase InsO family protein
MPVQLALRFDEVPVTCPVQRRYHDIAPCLAGKATPVEQARHLNLSYSTVARWLREFREQGMPGLFPATPYPREPYTPERVVVTLLYYKCCAPKASDRELARVIDAVTGHKLHNETVKALLERYFFWKHPEFSELIHYPVPSDPHALRREMVKLDGQGWTDKRIAELLHCSRKTVRKWLRRARQAEEQPDEKQMWLLDRSRAPRHTNRKVHFGVIHIILTLQKKYGYAGWFRIQGYLSQDYGIELGETAIKKVMALNRRLHLAPQRPVEIRIRDPREGPPKSQRPFEHVYVDFRYLDARPGGVQLYSCLLLEGHSRTILAGSLTRRQDAGVLLAVYYFALYEFGVWGETISDHGGQFRSHAFARVNRRLRIEHTMYEKGHPWQNLIESHFGIQARLGEYGWQKCKTVEEAQDFHRELIRDHNRLPHWAHRQRNDQKRTPLEVLGAARGRETDAATLHRAFSRACWQRRTDARGFVRIGNWKIYIEEGLPKTSVQVTYWDSKLRAEYDSHLLAEYRCKWDASALRPKAISHPVHYETPFQSPQQTLFDPLWLRDPVEQEERQFASRKRKSADNRQLRLYLGPELVKAVG